MPCLYLSEADVGQLADMPTAIDAMQEAFAALAAGRAENVPRRRAKATGIVLHSMSAAADYLGLPIVITATSSRVAVFDGHWLDDNVLVCAMGSNWLNKSELDITAVRRAARIVCDDIECCRLEAGDFTEALREGIFNWADAVELKDVVTRGQPAAMGVQLFKSVGMALEDVALGSVVLNRARERNVGRELILD